ncbi:hypothetical protein FMJ31_13040 [Klebsiella michiganensis]|nr:hypothetical protein [Klebsiella michiganensis]MBZ6746052.1 hypothetical protein [Klebsiella michiganensis]MBZ7414309.1 hypothetical protein [Klebsiella michiganensis]MBZ7426006.1 hypothetical protein [Klebsiella michiganensis]MBZ7476418.1 hypothetical protein [Klebsiella michiganensis]
MASSRAALRLPGLRGHGCLRAGSPGKAFTPQPGECAGVEALVWLRPGPRCACPGYGATAVCGPVARTGASSAASGNAYSGNHCLLIFS